MSTFWYKSRNYLSEKDTFLKIVKKKKKTNCKGYLDPKCEKVYSWDSFFTNPSRLSWTCWSFSLVSLKVCLRSLMILAFTSSSLSRKRISLFLALTAFSSSSTWGADASFPSLLQLQYATMASYRKYPRTTTLWKMSVATTPTTPESPESTIARITEIKGLKINLHLQKTKLQVLLWKCRFYSLKSILF